MTLHKSAAPDASAKGGACSASYVLADGKRVIARGARSEVMRAASRAPHGATIGVEGGPPSFQWDETLHAWVFVR